MSTHSTIIGGRGYVGSALADFLRARGQSVSLPSKGSGELFDRNLGQVFYCAEDAGGTVMDPGAMIETHAGRLSELLREAEFDHLVYLSSARVYDEIGTPVVDETAVLPLDPRNARHLYDLSKLLGEWLCLNLAPDKSAVARLSSVYDDNLEVPAFLPLLVRRLSSYGVASIQGWPQSAQDHVHMDDVCQALTAMAFRRTTGIVNVASGENVSNLALCRQILETTGLEVTMSPPDAPPAANPPRISVDRLKDELALAPRPVLEVLPEIIRAHSQPETVKKRSA